MERLSRNETRGAAPIVACQAAHQINKYNNRRATGSDNAENEHDLWGTKSLARSKMIRFNAHRQCHSAHIISIFPFSFLDVCSLAVGGK